MKKTLIAVAAAAALTTSAFAEITFGAWLRTITGVANNGEDMVTGMSNSWGGMRPSRIGVNWVSEDGMAGMKHDMYFNGPNKKCVDKGDKEVELNAIEIGDNSYLWLKPIEQVKLSIGKFDGAETGFRGDFCYGSWNWMRPNNWVYGDEGLTFEGSWRNGLMVEVDPVENLVLLAQLPVYNSDWGGNGNAWAKGADDSDDKDSGINTIEDTMKNTVVMASYTIDGIGKIKAGWFGDAKDETKDTAGKGKKDGKTGLVNVAFDLTAVENLYVTVGARFGVYDEKADEGKATKMAFSAGASYQVTEELKVSASGAFKQTQDKVFGKKKANGECEDDTQFSFGAGVDYKIADGLNACADVRFINTGYGEKGEDSAMSFLVGVNKSCGSNGSIGVGFQGSTNGCGLAGVAAKEIVKKDGSYKVADKTDAFVWAIPVTMSVWF